MIMLWAFAIGSYVGAWGLAFQCYNLRRRIDSMEKRMKAAPPWLSP